jgi:hypothetical protein
MLAHTTPHRTRLAEVLELENLAPFVEEVVRELEDETVAVEQAAVDAAKLLDRLDIVRHGLESMAARDVSRKKNQHLSYS